MSQFCDRPFVGCDVSFSARPRPPMIPILAIATQLPFADQSFDFVIVSDVLEHVPPPYRLAVIDEALRVTRRAAIIGFPCGDQAFDCDGKLAGAYDRSRRALPNWLKEHLLYPFPTHHVFDNLGQEWKLSSFGNESLNSHLVMMRREMRRFWRLAFVLGLAVLPRFVEYLLKRGDREPFYRHLFVVQRLNTRTVE